MLLLSDRWDLSRVGSNCIRHSTCGEASHSVGDDGVYLFQRRGLLHRLLYAYTAYRARTRHASPPASLRHPVTPWKYGDDSLTTLYFWSVSSALRRRLGAGFHTFPCSLRTLCIRLPRWRVSMDRWSACGHAGVLGLGIRVHRSMVCMWSRRGLRDPGAPDCVAWTPPRLRRLVEESAW
jgi:hypothetical protein